MENLISNDHRKFYLVGSGIASLASAAYLIRDGQISGDQIYIFEQLATVGGSLGASGNPETGYILRGGRMLNFSHVCTYDLLSFIPSLNHPEMSVLSEIQAFNKKVESQSLARVVENGSAINVNEMGFSNKDRLDLIELLGVTEEYLETKTIEQWFKPAFFKTNFWCMWATMFGFQPWHSAVECKRYLNRYIHEFERINILEGVDRIPYNQYDSMIRPLIKWLKEKGVNFEMEAEVTDLDFRMSGDQLVVEQIHYIQDAEQKQIFLAEDDLVLVNAGSTTADFNLGSMYEPPMPITKQDGGSWALWESIAKECPEFGNPSVFNSRIDESLWESFTVTCQGTQFFDLLQQFLGYNAGTDGLATLNDSNWLMSIFVPYQPHFIGQPENVTVFCGYSLFPDKQGNFVRKKMCDCTGEEILIELISHLGFAIHLDELLETSNCIPCLLPYITSQFLTRSIGDRPLVVPKVSKNLAFIGQFAEVPLDVSFTVEYAVRTAQTAVYQLLDLKREPLAMYQSGQSASILVKAIKSLVHQ